MGEFHFSAAGPVDIPEGMTKNVNILIKVEEIAETFIPNNRGEGGVYENWISFIKALQSKRELEACPEGEYWLKIMIGCDEARAEIIEINFKTGPECENLEVLN